MTEASTPAEGLSDEEAAARLERDGPNRLAHSKRRGVAVTAIGVLRQPMFLLLIATATVYAVLGSLGDALVLLVSVAAVAAISLVQEVRTERVLESLKELSSPRSRVVRGGRVRRIASQELVVGDRLLVGEGDRLACDAVLVQVNGLLIDESMLTGESAPVLKSAPTPVPTGGPENAAHPAQWPAPPLGAPNEQQPLHAAEHRVQAGTLVVQGDGVATVCATGARTVLGQIGGTLARIEPRTSRVQAELKRMVARVAVFAVIACLAAAVLYALRQESWTSGLLAGLTLAMALIPEEFAVVWTVMLALGAWRLAQRRVLTRQSQAIEALGTTTVLAVDKTGTLTHNRMELLALVTPLDTVTLAPGEACDERFGALLRGAALASVDDGIEPMDRALLRLRERSFGPTPFEGVLLQREGVATERPYFSQLWAHGDGAELAVKGAPEALLARCDIEPSLAARVAADAERLASQGLRVIGVARACRQGSKAPDPRSASLEWLGLLGFLDPVREGVPAAIAQCRLAGMRVVMITGDAPATARAIASVAGLDTGAPDGVVTGAQLATLRQAELDATVARTSIYARVSPAQKLDIVRALQRLGEVVAMTGDGVNDASALRAADIGVAMGQRGTDVAREAAALVLLDDSFASLVAAVRMGRRIFGNLRNAVGYLLAVHVPIVGVSLLPVLIGGPALLLPLHVVLLELIIDPACSLVFEAEPEPADCMRQPPRPSRVGLVSRGAVLRALGIGALAMLGVGLVVALARWAALEAEWVRLASLGGLVAGNLLMLQWYRSAAGTRDAQGSNRAFGWLLAGVAAACAAVLLAAPLLPQFGLPDHAGLGFTGLALALAAAFAAWRLRARSASLQLASHRT